MRNRATVCLLLAIAIFVVPVPSWGAGYAGNISGVVKNMSGQPVAGAFVKVRHLDRGLIFMVISQGQGTYRATDLPPGKYRVQGIGGGFQSNSSAAVEVDGSREVTVNLNLTVPQPN